MSFSHLSKILNLLLGTKLENFLKKLIKITNKNNLLIHKYLKIIKFNKMLNLIILNYLKKYLQTKKYKVIKKKYFKILMIINNNNNNNINNNNINN